MNYYIYTYGCQMNKADSDIVCGMLDKIGYKKSESPLIADIIILNTCSVRDTAARKVYGKLGELIKLKKEKDIIVGVIGCLAESDYSKLINSKYGVNFILGTRKLQLLPEIMEKSFSYPQVYTGENNTKFPLEDIINCVRENKFKAFVPVMRGCSYYCSFCIVPYTRGKQSSRRLKYIIREISELADNGCKEIILVGQTVNAYGKDLKEKVEFSVLLENISKIDGIERIRFTSPHPKDMTKDLIDTVARIDKVCNHFHLPLQSGSDKILKLMKRGYTSNDFLDTVSYIRKKIPRSSITTDMIVGFPSEDEKDFNATLKLVNEVRFDSAFTFKYSKRKFTKAALMKDLSEDIKRERLEKLNNIQNKISKEINENMLNEVFRIFVEGVSSKDSNKLFGRTDTNKIINFYGNHNFIGRFIDVKVTKTNTWTLEGEVIR